MNVTREQQLQTLRYEIHGHRASQEAAIGTPQWDALAYRIRMLESIIATLENETGIYRRFENIKKELQLAVDNMPNYYFWEGHGGRVNTLYDIKFDVDPAPAGWVNKDMSGYADRQRQEREAA
jgi:hypothetical protein